MAGTARRLHRRAWRRAPFEWGTHDCCKFAAGAVETITGENPMRDLHYGNEIGALRLIAEAGGQLETLVTERLGQPLASVAQAKRGDVVISDLDKVRRSACASG